MVRWEVEAGESLRTCSKLAFLAYKAVNGRDHISDRETARLTCKAAF